MATNHPTHYQQQDHAPKLQVYAQHNPFITQAADIYETANRNYSQSQNLQQQQQQNNQNHHHHSQNSPYSLYSSTNELQPTHSIEQTPSSIPCSLVSIGIDLCKLFAMLSNCEASLADIFFCSALLS